VATRVTTWNINSIRLRLPLLKRVVAETRTDVLCLQEIKVAAKEFPRQAVAALGFPHQLVRAGLKGQAGVAILSRRPIAEGPDRAWCSREDGRHLAATLDGIEIHDFYVPSGGDIPDPNSNEKFAHKLQFLGEMAEWFGGMKPGRRILVGDLNIAPLENDVWSHKQLLHVVSHTPVEVEKLARVATTLKWVDAVRHFVPEPEKLYTWWSYRNRTWPGSDRGRRLDHIWVTPALRPRLKNASVLREARGWPSPSDHVPVTVELNG
jgi:exodeoxyribonuclease-3